MKKSGEDKVTPETVTEADSCVEALKMLVKGEYSGWNGFTKTCTPSDVSRALGESEDELWGDLGGIAASYRVYSDTPASRYGALVWYIEDHAVALQMHTVKPSRPVKKQLGPPEAKDISRMPGFKTQWIYASRGLTFHIDDNTGKVAWLYAYRPMTLEEYRSSWLSRVEILRHRAL